MNKNKKKEGGVLVTVVIVVTAVFVLAIGFLRLHERDTVEAVYVEHSNQAFWLAEAGIQQLVSKLRNDPTFRANISNDSSSPDYTTNMVGNGSYEVKYWTDLTGTNFVVRSRGSVRNESRTIEVDFALLQFGPYGITTINGDSQIRQDSTIVGSIYQNGDLEVRNGTSISGTVLAENHSEFGDSGEPIPEDGQLDLNIDQTQFSPYFALADSAVAGTDPLLLNGGTLVYSSSLDPAVIGGPGVLVIKGDQTFSKDLVISNDVTIVVSGDLTIRKTATMGDNVTLYTAGEADLFKDATIGSTSTTGTGCSILALGDMKVWKNMEFYGTLFTEGYLTAEKNLYLEGTIVTHDGFRMKQDATVKYDQALISPLVGSMITSTFIVQNSVWKEVPVF